MASELCQILRNNKHTCTHKHTLLSGTHETKWLLAQDCGAEKAWALSASRLSDTAVLKAALVFRGQDQDTHQHLRL